MKRDQTGKDFHVLHKTRHQNTACLRNFSPHEAADFHLPKMNSVGRHIQRCAGPAYSVPVAAVLRHETLSAFHPIHHMHTHKSSLLAMHPCSCHSLAWLSHTQYNSTTMVSATHLQGRLQIHAIEHELSCNSGRQKVGSSGLHPCVHAVQLRTCIEQHMLLQVYPYCHLLCKKREVLGSRVGTWCPSSKFFIHPIRICSFKVTFQDSNPPVHHLYSSALCSLQFIPKQPAPGLSTWNAGWIE